MFKFALIVFGLLMTEAVPQYGTPPQVQSQPSQSAYGGAGQSQPAQSGYGGAGQSQPAQSAYGGAGQSQLARSSYGGAGQSQPAQSTYGGAGQSQPAQSAYGGAGQSQPAQSSYGGAGQSQPTRNDLTVQCKATPGSNGNLKYDCSGVNKDAVTLKTEHILWLESETQKPQNLDIEVPNYYIDEFIKAAFKALAPREADKISILLKKPYLSYNAQKDEAPKPQATQPNVKVNYQPIEKISVHYPTQKQYSSNGGSAGNTGNAPASYGANLYSR